MTKQLAQSLITPAKPPFAFYLQSNYTHSQGHSSQSAQANLRRRRTSFTRACTRTPRRRRTTSRCLTRRRHRPSSRRTLNLRSSRRTPCDSSGALFARRSIIQTNGRLTRIEIRRQRIRPGRRNGIARAAEQICEVRRRGAGAERMAHAGDDGLES